GRREQPETGFDLKSRRVTEQITVRRAAESLTCSRAAFWRIHCAYFGEHRRASCSGTAHWRPGNHVQLARRPMILMSTFPSVVSCHDASGGPLMLRDDLT